jgi:hypothetical protein
MRIKNVSSTDVKLPDLNLTLSPGEIKDLSSFDPKVLHTDKKLNAYFDKGLLVNLGSTMPSGSIAALKSARNRIDKMGFGESVAKQAKKAPSDNRKKISELLKRNDQRTNPNQGFDSAKERFSDEYYQNMNPGIQREDFSKPKPRPKIDERFKPMQLMPDGMVVEFGSHGKIQTAVLAGQTTALSTNLVPEKKKPEENSIEVADLDGNVYVVSLDKIKERLERKCLGFSSSGKPCKKWAVTGFRSCTTHMSRSEKREYERLKRESQEISTQNS